MACDKNKLTARCETGAKLCFERMGKNTDTDEQKNTDTDDQKITDADVQKNTDTDEQKLQNVNVPNSSFDKDCPVVWL